MLGSWCSPPETAALRRMYFGLSGDGTGGDEAGGCGDDGDGSGMWSGDMAVELDHPEDISDDPDVRIPCSRGDSRRVPSSM